MASRESKILRKARESYRTACAEYRSAHKSLHWDVFDDDFDRLFDKPQVWENLRNNKLASGMGGGGLTSMETLQISDVEIIKMVSNSYRALVEEEGLEFVQDAMEMDVGHPEFVECDGVRVGKQDILLVHNLRTALPWLDNVSDEGSSLIIEIGGGYGGLAAKIKKARPQAKIIIFDLPETGAIQYYYLSILFPERKILSLADVDENLSNFVKKTDFDILLLPGWNIENIDNDSVDMAISVRTFMELNLSVIEYYLDNLGRVLGNGGAFYLVSRIEKRTTGERNILKNYPFGKHWMAVRSEVAFIQKQLHELVLLRCAYPNAFPVKRTLTGLPPYEWSDVMDAVQTARYRFKILLWGGHPGVYGGLVPNIARRILSKVPLLRPLARFIKRLVVS